MATSAEVAGFGLFGGRDVRVRFCPAPAGHGLVFERIDLPDPVLIPALIDQVVPQPRCTVLATGDVQVAVTEHVLAALAGLRIDNCLIQVDAAELPILDGSAHGFCEAIQAAGVVWQDAPRPAVVLEEILVHTESEDVAIAAQPSREEEYQIGFLLDYGAAGIPPQGLCVNITPDSFLTELSRCRTFALESEVQQLRAAGLALRATPANAVVFGEQGVLHGQLRFPNECVRHKILDCVGDFALLGMDIVGCFAAERSGHRLNHEIIREIKRHIDSTQASAASHRLPPPHSAAHGPKRSRKLVKK